MQIQRFKMNPFSSWGSSQNESVCFPSSPSTGDSKRAMLYKKRAYEDVTSTIGTAAAPAAQSPSGPTKMQRTTATGELRNVVPSKTRLAALARGGGHVKASDGTWIMDAPDDVYYRATPAARKRRRGMVKALRRAARKPFKKVLGGM